MQPRELDWNTRVKILVDACRGLVYLHTAEQPLVHQDIKLYVYYDLVVQISYDTCI